MSQIHYNLIESDCYNLGKDFGQRPPISNLDMEHFWAQCISIFQESKIVMDACRFSKKER